MQLPAADRDAVVFMQLKLDPLSRHGRPQYNSVLDLKTLWTSVAQARKAAPPQPESLYPLAASAARLKEQEEKITEVWGGHMSRSYFGGMRQNFWSNGGDRSSPGEVLAAHEVVSQIIQLLAYSDQYD